MTTPTRYVLFGSGCILALGLVAGAVAYVEGGFPALARMQSAPEELRYFPASASVVAYADVHGVMTSELRQRLREAGPPSQGQRDFQSRTGIDIEKDVDRIVVCLVPGPGEPEGLMIVTGRFEPQGLEALAEAHGGTAEEYHGVRVVTRPMSDRDLAMAFLEPGVIAIGSTPTVRQAIDAPVGGDVTSNEPLMDLMGEIQSGSNAWLIARLDDPASLAWLPDRVQSQVPALDAFALAGRVNGGVSGRITAEARDEQAGQDLSDVVQGFLALARMQGGNRPELTPMLEGLQLTRTGRRVTLSFDLSPNVVEMAIPQR
jgi:hypothetical protein